MDAELDPRFGVPTAYDFRPRAAFDPGSLPAFGGGAPRVSFDPAAPGHAPANALWLAGIAHLAYHAPASRAAELDRLGLRLAADRMWALRDAAAAAGHHRSAPAAAAFYRRLAAEVEVGTTRAFIAAGEGFAAVAFEGTTRSFEDIAIDLDARLVPLRRDGDAAGRSGAARVHAGFRRAVDGIGGELERALAAAGEVPLWFTGHSMGGALAALAAARFLGEMRLGGVVTFGAPRPGDGEFARSFEGRPTSRWFHGCDPVPDLPPSALGFRHVGEPRFLDPRGSIVSRPGRRDVRRARRRARIRFSARAPWRRRGHVKVRGLADHAISNYQVALARAMAGPE